MFRYEKLQGFCYGCGVIGHYKKGCRKSAIMTAICNEIPLYGAKLSVLLARSLSLLIKEQGHWWREKEATGVRPQENPGKEGDESSKRINNGGATWEEEVQTRDGGMMG